MDLDFFFFVQDSNMDGEKCILAVVLKKSQSSSRLMTMSLPLKIMYKLYCWQLEFVSTVVDF